MHTTPSSQLKQNGRYGNSVAFRIPHKKTLYYTRLNTKFPAFHTGCYSNDDHPLGFSHRVNVNVEMHLHASKVYRAEKMYSVTSFERQLDKEVSV